MLLENVDYELNKEVFQEYFNCVKVLKEYDSLFCITFNYNVYIFTFFSDRRYDHIFYHYVFSKFVDDKHFMIEVSLLMKLGKECPKTFENFSAWKLFLKYVILDFFKWVDENFKQLVQYRELKNQFTITTFLNGIKCFVHVHYDARIRPSSWFIDAPLKVIVETFLNEFINNKEKFKKIVYLILVVLGIE